MSENYDWRSGEYLFMTTHAEEESNPPEIAEMVRLDGSVVKALEYQSKVRGFKTHSSPYLA